MFTARERQQLRNRIARRAAHQCVPNPLVSEEEAENELLDMVEIILERHADRTGWGKHSLRLTYRPRILDPKKGTPHKADRSSRILDS